MNEFMETLSSMVEEFGSAPTIEEMERRTLEDKGINGPTAAHVIEEVHCPLNLAYLTFTTGSSAFQNIVGITHAEIDNRVIAAQKALERLDIKPGQKMLITYPPLVSVFSRRALDEYGLNWTFLRRSNRDAFLSTLYHENPDVILGESTFIKASLEDAKKMGLAPFLPNEKIIIAAGTPLDLDLINVAEKVISSKVHDLYGCQEFGWLILDGVPLRDDLSFIKSTLKQGNYIEIVVGGLPMGDSFVYSETGHVCNVEGKIITYRRKRTYPEYEVIVKATTLANKISIDRVARTILRIKGRIVKVSPQVEVASSYTSLELKPSFQNNKEDDEAILINGPEKTKMFDDLIKAQLDYQQLSKQDPTWIKSR